MGRKLTEHELKRLNTVLGLLWQSPDWDEMEGGGEYWAEVHYRLRRMRDCGTVDGKLPEPEFELVTPTDEDAKGRPQVEVANHDSYGWQTAELVYVEADCHKPFFAIVCGEWDWFE